MRDAYELATWQWLPRPRPEVFAFFANARNLERITHTFEEQDGGTMVRDRVLYRPRGPNVLIRRRL